MSSEPSPSWSAPFTLLSPLRAGSGHAPGHVEANIRETPPGFPPMPVRVPEWVLAGTIEAEDVQGQWVLGTAIDCYVHVADNRLYYIVEFGEPKGRRHVLSGDCECIMRFEESTFPFADENVEPEWEGKLQLR